MGHLGSLGTHFGDPLGPLWRYLGATFGIRWCLWDTLGSLWGHLEVILGALLVCEDDFGIIIMSSWLHKSEF